MVFVLLVAFLPTMYAVTVSIAYGVSLVVILSYLISKEQKVSPWAAILQHVAIVVLVIIASSFVGEWIAGIFRI